MQETLGVKAPDFCGSFQIAQQSDKEITRREISYWQGELFAIQELLQLAIISVILVILMCDSGILL